MAWGGSNQSTFATFLILCPTCFFLGIIFSLFPYDYPLLWTPLSECPESAFVQMEAHLSILYNSPNVIARILHTVIGIGLLGFFMKLYRPSESNMLFDGASLVLYMIALVVYMANIIKGIRVVSGGKYDVELVEGETVVAIEGARMDQDTIGRDDSLRVLAASNTILALVLAGVLVLQAGQWYAERKQRQEMEMQQQQRSQAPHQSTQQQHQRQSPGRSHSPADPSGAIASSGTSVASSGRQRSAGGVSRRRG